MREAETGFVVDDGDDAAQYMTFDMGEEGSADEGDGEGQKKKSAKKRGALNALVRAIALPAACCSPWPQPTKRKKEDLPEVAPSHRISHMFLHAKVSAAPLLLLLSPCPADR
jgi:hypothetical protein